MDGWMVFTISGERINPTLISQHLNIKPDKAVLPDDSNEQTGLWQLNSRLKGHDSLDRHFHDLFNRLLPVREKLMEFSKEARFEFYCAMIKEKHSAQTLKLSPETLLLIGHLGANLEIDIQS